MQQKINNRIHFFLTSLLAFFMPVHSDYLPVVIALMTLNWIWYIPNYKKSLQTIRSNYALLFMILLYMLNVFGLIYTVNFKFAGEELETKLSFLIMPLIFAAHVEDDSINLYRYLKFFVYGCIVYSLICLGYAFYAFYKPVYTDIEGHLYNFGSNYFYYTYLSLFFHPTYAAIYSSVAVFIIYTFSERKKIVLNPFWIAVIVLLSVFVLLLSSKAGWLSILIVYMVIGYKFIREKRITTLALTFALLAGSFLFLNVFNAPQYSQRIPEITSIENSLAGKDKENRKVNTGAEGSARRIFVWKASWSVFKNHFLFGVGTGDSKDVLMEKYKELNMQNEYENKLNSHNQFFTYMLSFGIFGLIIFLSCLIYPLKNSAGVNFALLAVFISIIALNCLFESIFERQDGVIFYALFHSLLCATSAHKG